jgi:hypothetical protein
LFTWGGRKTSPPASPSAAIDTSSEPVAVSKVLPKVLAALSGVEAPAIMDLGPVVGKNISFFGEELACRIFVEDLYALVETHAAADNRAALGEAITARLTRETGSIDGILCWDLFDHLDKASSAALATQLMRVLKPGGVLYAFFGSKAEKLTTCSHYIVEGRDRLRMRAKPCTPTQRNVLVVRDVNRMFEGLVVSESVLLKSNARETLFRKPI